jgi:uncharacterized membrane protein YphA (DoxX/SURF4 family)
MFRNAPPRFTDEYQVPLLPPELAATMAASIELTTPVLLGLGFLTRAAALMLPPEAIRKTSPRTFWQIGGSQR